MSQAREGAKDTGYKAIAINFPSEKQNIQHIIIVHSQAHRVYGAWSAV
jgi:hypothetical protein